MTASEPVAYAYTDSPVGTLLIAGDAAGLKLVNFHGGRHPVSPDTSWRLDEPALADAIGQLQAYFAGKLRAFHLKLAPDGTPFQQDVWRKLRSIPYGETISYGELARRVGRPLASRAVGAANGRNPLPIVVPCHRVVGANGSLVGFGGGLPIKAALLALERSHR